MFDSIELLNFIDSVEIYRKFYTLKRKLLISFSNINEKKIKQKIFQFNDTKVKFKKTNPADSYILSIKPGGLSRFYSFKTHKKVIPPHCEKLRAVFIGSGRCGTTSIVKFLHNMSFNDGEKVIAQHETLFDQIFQLIMKKDFKEIKRLISGFSHNVESAAHLTLIIEHVPTEKVIHIIRDGRRVVQSGINRGWYQKDTLWNQIKPEFNGSVFEKCCQFWTCMNEKAQEIAHATFKVEDLNISKKAMNMLLDELNIQRSDQQMPVANVGKIKSGFGHWSAKEKEIFESLCGQLMDQYYPDWRSEN